MSGIWTAVRLTPSWRTDVRAAEQAARNNSEPVVACRRLVEFDLRQQPVYKTYYWNHQGAFYPPVLARRFDDHWWIVDPIDAITALADRLDKDYLIARSHRHVDRKQEFGIEVGREHVVFRRALDVLRRMRRVANPPLASVFGGAQWSEFEVSPVPGDEVEPEQDG